MLSNSYYRFDRQTRLAGWQQDRLYNSRVMILGAGALGNEVVKNLALTGIGNILVIDHDRVEMSNLSRTVLFSEDNIGHYKAETLANVCKKLYPSINASYINGDLMYDLGLGFYKEADLVIGCLDNVAARSKASISAALAGTPYLDAGVWGYGGELKWFFPENSACYDCSLSEKDKNDVVIRYSCAGFKSTVSASSNAMIPSTLAPAAVIAGMAVQEACHYFSSTRKIIPGDIIVYNGLEPSLHKSFLPQNPLCEHHVNGPYQNVIKLPYRAHEVSAREILHLASETLGEHAAMELSRDFLMRLYCRHCERAEIINDLISKVPEEKSFCPLCKKRRDKQVITSLTSKDPVSDSVLSMLGIPKGEILIMHSPKGMEFYQLNGDVQALLPVSSHFL